MDNECSTLLADYMTKQGIDYQLVPVGQHRRNAAERAIRTFKNHFIAGLCTTNKQFPLHLWDKLVFQALLTLNLMRRSRINPNLSAWAQVYGNYDFNCTPISPPGIRVLVHKKPDNRTTWVPHAIKGWYVGPAMQSYHCYCTWITETKRERMADTLTWFPTCTPMPTALSNDIIASATRDILHALKHPTNGSLLAPMNDTEMETLQQITEILYNKTNATTTDTKPTTDTPEDLRVPSEPEATINHTPGTNTVETTYQQSTRPKKQTNKHKQQRGKLAANDNAVRETAHYAAYLIRQDTPLAEPYQDYICYSAIHPDTRLPSKYRELHTSSEGAAWITETADEIG